MARLRVECLRLGITELTVTVPRTMGGRGGATGTRATAKLSPLTLPASAEVRLRRLAPGATYQTDLTGCWPRWAPPSGGTGYAPVVVDLLRQLMPPSEPAEDDGTAGGDAPDLSALASTR